MTAVFWISVGCLLAVYLGYPAALYLLGALRRQPTIPDETYTPTVTIVVPAYNEEPTIGARLDNLLQLDYPEEKLRIIVLSESDDRTNTSVAPYASRGVRLVGFSKRRGKCGMLYDTVPHLTSDVVVLTDANVEFRPDALRKLVRHFSDPRIGAVSGRVQYIGPRGARVTVEGLYWHYEEWLKRAESRLSSLLGSVGAIFAIQRKSYAPLSFRLGDDFELTVRTLLQGKGAILDSAAIATEVISDRPAAEFHRRQRIGGTFVISTVLLGLEAFRGRRFLVLAQLLFHRVLRWLTPVFLAGLAISSWALEGWLFSWLFRVQFAFYAIALAGWMADRMKIHVPFLVRIPYHLCAVFLGSFIGCLVALYSPPEAVWEKQR